MTTIDRSAAETFLSTDDLVARWQGRIAKNTIVNWRGLGRGPRWHKLGHKVMYRLDHVHEWESANTTTTGEQ